MDSYKNNRMVICSLFTGSIHSSSATDSVLPMNKWTVYWKPRYRGW